MLAWVKTLDDFLERTKTRYLGLGLLIAWVYCSWFSGSIFGPGNDAAAISTLRVSLLFSAVGLAVLVFRPRKRTPLSPVTIFLSALIVTLTTFLSSFLSEGPALLAISAAGGFVSAVLWVAWGELLCQIGQDITESCIPASLVVFAVACIVVYIMPAPFSGILSALLPLASCVMLLLGRNSQPSDFLFPAAKEPFSHVFPSLAKLALCSMTCSAANGFVVTVTSFGLGEAFFSTESLLLFYIVGGIAAAIISLLSLTFASRLNFSLLYQCVIPLIVFSLSLKALGGTNNTALALVLACTASLCVDALFYAIFARITMQRFCLPSETFGIFRAAAQAGFLIGGLLSAWSVAEGIDSLAMSLGFICICVVMLPLFLHLQKRFDTAPADEQERPADSASSIQGKDVLLEIIDAYKLSAREAEVLRFLSKGRSVPYMREAMTLSKSTIETHIKHIYAKVDVHSKQELIDLIESYQESAGMS